MRVLARPALLALFASLAGCSGAGGALPPSTQPAAVTAMKAAAPHATATVQFVIRVPKAPLAPNFVSPNTQSIAVALNGQNLRHFDVVAGSPGCANTHDGLVCKLSVGAPIGTSVFKLSAYSQKGAKGTLLSVGTISQKVTVDTTVIPIVLNGIVSSIAISLGDESPRAGHAATIPVYVRALDPSGATIVGAEYYNVPITLTNGDSTGITTLSPSKVNGPSDQVTLTYNGKSIVASTIGATAKGVSQANVTRATLHPAPAIFASYAIPSQVGAGSAALAIAVGPDGNLWYTTQRCQVACTHDGNDAIVRTTTTGVATAFVAGTTPNLLAGAQFNGIAAGWDGNVWFTDGANRKIGRITPAGVVTEFNAPGAMCPNRIVPGTKADGGLWFTSSCNNQIGRINKSGSSKATALGSGGADFEGIVLGSDGRFYVVDRANAAIGQVRVVAEDVTGYSEVAVGANAIDGLSNAALLGIEQGADGTLWFTNRDCAPSTIGSVSIANPFTASSVNQYVSRKGCAAPAFLAAMPGSNTVFATVSNYPVFEAIAPQGSGDPVLTDYTLTVTTPNSVLQGLYDVVVGPDGNLWATVNTNADGAANIVVFAY